MESVIARRSTRHIRVDHRFAGLLVEDFGIPLRDIEAAFIGFPSIPQRQAIALCEWAIKVTRSSRDAGKAIKRWAKKHGKGQYNPAILEGPEIYEEEDR